jgi:hypothetical protein
MVIGEGPGASEHVVTLSDENHARIVKHAKIKYPHVYDMDGKITGEIGKAIDATESESVTMLLTEVTGALIQRVKEREIEEMSKKVKEILLHPEPGRPVGMRAPPANPAFDVIEDLAETADPAPKKAPKRRGRKVV